MNKTSPILGTREEITRDINIIDVYKFFLQCYKSLYFHEKRALSSDTFAIKKDKLSISSTDLFLVSF